MQPMLLVPDQTPSLQTVVAQTPAVLLVSRVPDSALAQRRLLPDLALAQELRERLPDLALVRELRRPLPLQEPEQEVIFGNVVTQVFRAPVPALAQQRPPLALLQELRRPPLQEPDQNEISCHVLAQTPAVLLVFRVPDRALAQRRPPLQEPALAPR